jgi:ABC-type glycerol-3-phosphate transport system substrate-binding protein
MGDARAGPHLPEINAPVRGLSALFNSYGVVMVDTKDNIKIDSDETRAALEYLKKLMAVNPPEVYAWDDAGNNRWLISGKGSGIMNPPSAWAVAKRDNPKVAEKCWTHPMPKGPNGRFVGQLPTFAKNKSAAKELLLYLSQKTSVAKLVEASFGYDLPAFQSMYDLDTWKTVGPPLGTVYNYPPSRPRSPGRRRAPKSARKSTTRQSIP